ncbi:uncharacterized protein TNCV_4170601 [Trichonephila clavipes]|nr:uncharacterized protein TNCV_4170601 [Trichonephila clavipes]
MEADNIDCALVQEPHSYRSTLPGYPSTYRLFYDPNSDIIKAAIIVRSRHLSTFIDYKNSYYNMVTLEVIAGSTAFTLFSYYFEPSKNIDSDLHKISQVFSSKNLNRLVWSMDSNSKSELWFSPYSDARGNKLSEFISANNLFIINEDCGPTFRATQGTSYIDITVVGSDLLEDNSSCCLSENEFLSDHIWKLAQVILISKVNEFRVPHLDNLRCISLLPALGKCLEKLFVNRISWYLRRGDFLSSDQYGFTPHKSTEDALLRLNEIVKRGKKKHLHSILISLDIKGAFDNAWWPCILNLLKKAEIPINIFSLVADFLNDRVAKMQLAFADDILVCSQGRDLSATFLHAQEALNFASDWSKSFKLDFNPDKTRFMAIEKRNVCYDAFQLYLDGTPLTMLQEHREDFPVICYTDGSKIDGRVGFAFVVFRSGVESENFQFRIRDECTVFVAELLCLNFAVKWIAEQNSVISECLICTDSLSSLDSLKCISPSNNIIVEIQKQLKSLRDKNISIDFAFVRGHTGVLGNERADWLPKAATKRKIDIDVNISKSFYKKITNERMMKCWNQKYLISNKGSITKKIFPTINKRLSCHHFYTNYKLTQLLTGHGNFKNYLNKFNLAPSSFCDCNIGGEENVEHVILLCSNFLTFSINALIKSEITTASPWESNGNGPELITGVDIL